MRILLHGDSWGRGDWRYISLPKEENPEYFFHPFGGTGTKVGFKGGNKLPRGGNPESTNQIWLEESQDNGLTKLYTGVTHLGLQLYLSELGHTVLNLSSGGYSPYNIFGELNARKDLHTFDYIFIFVPLFGRDMREKGNREGDWRYTIKNWKIKSEDELINKFNLYKKELYTRYNTLAKDNGVKFLLIGGSQKINEKDFKDYDNLECVVPSMLEHSNFNLKQREIELGDELIAYLNGKSNKELSHLDDDVKEYLIDMASEYGNLLYNHDYNGNNNYFPRRFPGDDWVGNTRHPTRRVHFDLFNLILKKYKINI
jgi:hypothetical protein